MRTGRFQAKLEETIRKMNASVAFDRRLYRQDIRGSEAYARALARVGIISEADLEAILGGLAAILKEIEAGSFEFSDDLEDIHMNIEARLTERIGEPGARLHTGRSRNDQVVTDLRLYLREEAEAAIAGIEQLARGLLDVAEREVEVLVPAYTHLQRAQPVLLAHHLLSYVEMLRRDRGRFEAARRSADVLPLGSGAVAGNACGIDREFLRQELGFAALSHNSMDAVSDRDFVLDYLYACSVLAIHLSRFAEDVILWSSEEFGWVILDDRVSTGSSLLPHKRNPDACELLRGKTGRLLGHLLALSVTLKGLPLTYNKDLQEDKEGLFDGVETIRLLLAAAAVVVETLRFDHTRIAEALQGGYVEAVGLSDYLVAKGMPFREAHRVVGEMVRAAEKQGKTLAELDWKAAKKFSNLIEPDVAEQLGARSAVERMGSIGGTAPQRVREEIARGRRDFEGEGDGRE